MTKVVFSLIVFCCLSTNVYAGYADGVNVARVRIHDNGEAFFGVDVQPVGTCSNWGEYLKFDHTTPAGKTLMSALLVAKSSGKPIGVWYDDSSVPGATQENGCSESAMAVLTAISL